MFLVDEDVVKKSNQSESMRICVQVIVVISRTPSSLLLNSSCVRSRTKVEMKPSFGAWMNFVFWVDFIEENGLRAVDKGNKDF